MGFCRTTNWKTKTPDIISKITHIKDVNTEPELVGKAQIQGLRWGGVEVFCVDGSPGLAGQSLVLYDQKIPTSGWIKFKIRAPHPLSKRGLFAFYSVSDPVDPEGLIVWLMEKRMVLRNYLIQSLSQSTSEYESLCSFWSSAIFRYDIQSDSQLKRDLRSLGLGAIFAVSGLHVNLIALLIIMILSFIPTGVRERWILFVFFVMLYASIVGFTASVFRALCFAFLIKTGGDSGLSSRNIRLLSAVFLIHILTFPAEVVQVGFLLSYGLTFFLLFLGSSFSIKSVKHLLLQGACLQILLIPYFLWQFGEYPLLHFACVFLAPIFSIILAVGFFVSFLSIFSVEFASGILDFAGPLMEFFIHLCSQWGQKSEWLLVPTETFDGRLVVIFYTAILLYIMRVGRLKINIWQRGIESWENFIQKNGKQPYELYSSVYESIFRQPFEPAFALKTLQINATIQNWNSLAYLHLYQAWIQDSFESVINPVRRLVMKYHVPPEYLTDPLFRHYVEGRLHLQWSKQNLLRLSGWLLNVQIDPELDKELRPYRNRLQKLLSCNFLESPGMRFLESSCGSLLNRLPVHLKSSFVNKLNQQLLSNST